jgi:hypothetical protein
VQMYSKTASVVCLVSKNINITRDVAIDRWLVRARSLLIETFWRVQGIA